MTSLAPPVRQSRAGIGAADLIVLCAVLLAGCGHLLIKSGLTGVTPQAAPLQRLLGYILSPGVVGGLMVYGLGTVLWIVAVSRAEISYLFPITSLNYVLIAASGVWLFGEPVSAGRWAGILVVMLGVALMQTSSQRRTQ